MTLLQITKLICFSCDRKKDQIFAACLNKTWGYGLFLPEPVNNPLATDQSHSNALVNNHNTHTHFLKKRCKNVFGFIIKPDYHLNELWCTMVFECTNTWYHHLTFLKWIGDIIGSVFSPLISHMFLITCERPCQPACEILLYLPLCLHTSTHTQLISFKETFPLKAVAPREVCVCDREK